MRTRRALGALIAVAGALLLADVALTLAWREPLSWLADRHDQPRLERRLAQVQRELAADLERSPTEHRPVGADATHSITRAARLMARQASDGSPLGRIAIPAIGARFVIVQGTSSHDLRGGPGHYPATTLPGLPGTVGLAGHRTTHLQPFRHLDALRPGDAVTLTMPYGRFSYRVASSRIVTPAAAWVLARRAGSPRLVLTACHPLFSAAQRIVVTATLVRSKPRGAAA